MTEPRRSVRPSPHRSSSALAPANTSDSTSIRPRNRRLASALDDDSDTATSREASRSRRGRNINVHDTAASPSPARSYGLLTALSPANSRSASPLPSERGGTPHRTNSAANLSNFLNDSLTQSWASIQGFTSSLLSGDNGAARRSQSHNRAGSRPGTWGRDFSGSGGMKKTGGAWGPAPPQEPNLNDVGAGSLAEWETALKAARRAMVLESHDGVNGGLDVSGNHKRRNSDESTPEQTQAQEYLVYIHKVEPSDTYAGIILKYQCREDAFRKANGLWTRDSIQVRKWLTIPVDVCDVRGRPCDPPSWHNAHSVDLLAPTPAAEENSSVVHDDFFSRPINGRPSATQPSEEEERPWTHVRWVKIDSIPQPVEVARVARNAMGYFPPRRKKSIRTVSTFSTPRQSLDLYSNPPGSAGTSSRRQSSLGHRPQLSGTVMSSPGRGAISEGGETLPAWMRRPGGVGSMGMSTRAPGPDKDYLTTWTKKHLPGLTLEGIPSMSIMGSETAHFGFKSGESSSIVENPSGEGQEIGSTQQGNGLDKAAAAVETWLRGALSRKPSSQLDRIRGMPEGSRPERNGDLIELTDTGSDDGRPSGAPPTSLMESLQIKSSSRSEGEGGVRGRMVAKGDKDD
ncbi:hypothetical protein H9Q69_000123 [Fusarium xylarioides]|uniref:LysM domain-containing protein n=1 Tax=Fusarium xylarioides TaxID=221167 RepID=A0A9P7L5I6_9HYPO|nr:hypothetical protein H9Q70_001399 [Fusarium xylarioides]KAG5765294.1 hypothetical protein H9Q72_006636 [Fusarium xylarioides]KAG5785263.1 hypothetical protein H9Q73_001127 [Fusarium xylarioides]KAG5800776.1 hypothetical protein H9Q69_000123 [Fusarium xylarioides]KAG5821919.1 hypothetical protein H9Q71_000008 [Fusarium xylarioides]